MNSIELVKGVLNTMRVEGSPLTTEVEFDMMEQAVREQIAKEIEDLIDPPPIDEIDYIIVDVIKKCADVARGIK